MARSRNIKPGLFKNEILGVADPIYTIAFEGLWILADKDGRLEDRPLRIKAEVFPYRPEVDMVSVLVWLRDNGFIFQYTHGENRYIEIANFSKHQNPHKNEAESTIPPYTKLARTNTEEIGTKSESIGTAPADSLNLIPDSLIPDKCTGAPAQKKKMNGENPTVKTLIDMGVNPQAAHDWLIVRKAKDGPLTQTALDDLKREAGKAGITVAEAVLICARKNWRGFNASWDWRDAMPKKTAAELLDEAEAARH